ncbi:MAG: PDZ domain-containing protein [Phycisphaerales bacterium]|nr:PDZ domain-containing protein [Phycisphaerales bacterium]
MPFRVVVLVISLASSLVSSTAGAQGKGAPDAAPPRLSRRADPPTVVKVKVDPPGDAVPGRRDEFVSTTLHPAPEVVRLWSAEVIAQVRITAHVLNAVAELDSPEFKTREAATARLSDPSVPTEEIFAVLVRGHLSDEQCERLLTVAREKVLDLPRGALGLRMQPSGDPRNPGVEVVLLLPGLPAERVLKIGDRIELIDEKPVATSGDLVEIIQSKSPGESVRLSVARQLRDERGKPRLHENGGFIEDRMVFDVVLTTATDLEKFDDRFPMQTRSVILDRRLIALREAEQRFSPATTKVGRPAIKLPSPQLPLSQPSPPQFPTKGGD